MFGLFKRREAKSTAPGILLGEGVCAKVYQIDKVTVMKVYVASLGMEYSDLVPNPKQLIAEGERDAWNAFYSRYMPKYANARIDPEGRLLLPKIPGVAADTLEDPPRFLTMFKKMVSDLMHEITGHSMKDQKNMDILISNLGKESELLLPVDFGEFGMYRLIDEANRALELK